jgi:hypothetical protein
VHVKLFVVLMSTSVTRFASSAFAQSQASPPDSEVEELTAEAPPAGSVASEIESLKAENAVVRELLHRMEEQQKALLEQVDRLQRRLDGSTVAEVPAVQPAEASVPSPAAPQEKEPEGGDRYQDGIVIAHSANAKLPFLLRLNNNTQVRYLNTTSSDDTFTDHLGVVREVNQRNDITVNRSMFILGGYIWDPKLRYSLTVWTSAGSASIVVAGNIGWQFNRGFTLTGGYTGVPGSRTLVNTFPFFASSDRTMADNFFRPAFTQGIWANGEPVDGLHYLAFVGNGLNTLNISASKIDTHLAFSGSTWWEPLGNYGEPGKSRNMYDDYFDSRKTRIRIGTSFTRAREDRFSNLDQSSPENTAMHNSDGVLTFETGAFAPGVTLQQATYRMWAMDGGIKYNGLAVNGQYFFRWLSDFVADGPLPLDSTFDHGFELVAGKFVAPKVLMPYVRGSMVFGQFGDSWEYAGGVKWYVLPTERFWLAGELMRVNKVPYGGTFTPYFPGLSGWVPMIQSIIAF